MHLRTQMPVACKVLLKSHKFATRHSDLSGILIYNNTKYKKPHMQASSSSYVYQQKFKKKIELK